MAKQRRRLDETEVRCSELVDENAQLLKRDVISAVYLATVVSWPGGGVGEQRLIALPP